jgi:hypothetical protein
MTPKQKRLKIMKRNRMFLKIKKAILGLFFLAMVILSISLILGSIQ